MDELAIFLYFWVILVFVFRYWHINEYERLLKN